MDDDGGAMPDIQQFADVGDERGEELWQPARRAHAVELIAGAQTKRPQCLGHDVTVLPGDCDLEPGRHAEPDGPREPLARS